MNPFIYPVVCDVCGGEGVGSAKTAAAMWSHGHIVTHDNPAVCIENLQHKAKAKEPKQPSAK